jgi:SagB-type dehydrogenase family enzyme
MTGGARNSRSTGTVKRWAATAGNLGSVELYLAVRSVEGLAPGFYYYRPFEHSLARFERRYGALPIEEFMHRTLPPRAGSLPEALVLFTGAFHRIARKYGSFGYRLITLDAGAAISQLHVVGRTLNIKSQTAARWADDLIEEQLNLEPFEEQSTGVVALSRREELYAEAQGIPPNSPHGLPGSSKETGYFFERSVEQVLKELYWGSRMSESELRFASFEPSGTAASADEQLPLVSLPHPSLGGRSVGEVLLGRESVRQFAHLPVSKQQLSTMLYWAHQGDVEDWPEQHAQGHTLTFLLLADRVEGLAPGTYRYKFDPENPALQFVGPLCSPKERMELFVQSEFAAAPLFIWIAGNLLAACDRQGAFGHRQLLLRAGAAGHRLWMGASAMGVSGCLVAGLVPGVARRQLHLDGYLQASLFGFAAGYSAQNFVSPDASKGF